MLNQTHRSRRERAGPELSCSLELSLPLQGRPLAGLRRPRPAATCVRSGSAHRRAADLSTVVSDLCACYEGRCAQKGGKMKITHINPDSLLKNPAFLRR